MDLLESDIQENLDPHPWESADDSEAGDGNESWETSSWKKGTVKSEKTGKNGEWEWEEDAGETKDRKNNQPRSGSGNAHISPEIRDKLDFLEELDALAESERKKELEKKMKDVTKYNTEGLLSLGKIGEAWKQAAENILTRHKPSIEKLVEFFIKELHKLDTTFKTSEYESKKWRLNNKRVMKAITDDPFLSEIDTKRLYDRKDYIEHMEETLKNIDLTFAIDISGSTSSFRGVNGIMNIIPTILFATMKNLEQHIQNVTGNREYKIPVEFILYGDGTPYNSLDSDFHSEHDIVRIAEMNDALLRMDWGTNDITAWQKISAIFQERLQKDETYRKEILQGARRPIILQIADTDVSENGVEVLREALRDPLENKSELIATLPIKRIVLGNVDIQEITQEEYERRKQEHELRKMNGHLDNWEPIFLSNGKVQMRQISILSEKQIIDQIQKLFENFFYDMTHKKT